MRLFSFTQNCDTEHEYCPNCKMVLEDPEVCNFCDWTSNDEKQGD